MKAAVYRRYGPPDVLNVVDVAKPSPAPREVLIKVMATTVHTGDIRMRKFSVAPAEWLFARLYLGVFAPRRQILGMELSGVVEAIGSEVTRFKPGDEVMATTLGAGFGGYAEYKCMKADSPLLAPKPGNLSFEEAAALPASGLTALRLLRRAKLAPGKKALIYGASGSAGTYAVQLAKHAGAEVTAVAGARNAQRMAALGADHVVDYKSEDFTRSGVKYDLVFDAVAKLDAAKAKSALAAGGVYINIVKGPYPKQDDDMLILKDLAEAGALTPVVDRTFTLDQIAEAHRYVEEGHKTGNVVVRVADV